uniref:Trimethylguanosine synthase n=1 Tax=Arcella intermedia TaxID=1963864 RepID=A0A6B2LRJ7_9EUKA
MDLEGWYSVTPEVIANHTAYRICHKLGPNAIILDAMSGVGGNAIQFAQFFHTVYAIDNNRERLELAKHNAQVYGVQEKIHFLAGDFLKILEYWRFRVSFEFLF